jgi:Tfp pilus assembly protein PilX
MRHAKQKNTTHRRGFTFFYAALVASLLLAIGLAIFDITFKQLLLSSDARESQSAFYAADNGLECALFWDIKHTGLSSPAFGFYGSSLGS